MGKFRVTKIFVRFLQKFRESFKKYALCVNYFLSNYIGFVSVHESSVVERKDKRTREFVAGIVPFLNRYFRNEPCGIFLTAVAKVLFLKR